MDARCVVDGAVWYRRRHCVLLSTCASDRGCPDYGVGGSGGRFGRYGIHGNGGGLATGDGYRSGAHSRISAVLALVAVVDPTLRSDWVLLVAGCMAVDTNARHGG